MRIMQLYEDMCALSLQDRYNEHVCLHRLNYTYTDMYLYNTLSIIQLCHLYRCLIPAPFAATACSSSSIYRARGVVIVMCRSTNDDRRLVVPRAGRGQTLPSRSLHVRSDVLVARPGHTSSQEGPQQLQGSFFSSLCR